jgi:hypothetical protein
MNRFFFILALVALVAVLGCQSGLETKSGNDLVSPTPADEIMRITDDFRRLRKGCSEMDRSEFSYEDEMLYRRVLPTQLAELGTKVIFGQFCDFKGVELITNFFPNKPSDQALREFLADRPTAEDLAAELGRILSAREAEPRGQAGLRFDEVFSIPQLAVSAAIEPQLVDVNSRTRRKYREQLINQWLTRIAQNPAYYQSTEGILSIFNEFRENGWSLQ